MTNFSEIQTGYVPNTSTESHRYTNGLCLVLGSWDTFTDKFRIPFDDHREENNYDYDGNPSASIQDR